MRRIAAALVALALLLSASGLAFRGEGYPAWDGSIVPPNTLCAAFGDDRISLNFDPSDEYSNVLDGIIQACFFAYDASETNYLELYLLIPQNILSGDKFISGEGTTCSVCLYETSVGSETFYSAVGGDRDGSSYRILLESVEFGDSTITVNGQFSARLCRYDGNQPTQDFLTVGEAHFGFTLPLTSADPKATREPDAFPALPDDTSVPDASAAPLPEATNSPDSAFPSFPDSPGATFPALPETTAPSGATFPGFTDAPRSGGAPAFTLPPDYAVI